MAKTLEQLSSEQLDEREQELLSSLPTEEPNILGPAGLDIREQELIDSLRSDGVEVDEPEIDLSPEESFQRDKDIQSLSKDPNTSELSFNEIIDNSTSLKLNPTIIETPEGKIGFVETFKDIRIKEKLPFVGSLYKVERITDVMLAAQTLNTGKITVLERSFITTFGPTAALQDATEAQKKKALKTIEDWVLELEEKQRRGITIGGRIAEGITELPAFMIEFLLTGPLFKVGSAAGKTAATKLLGRFAEKGVGKLAVKVAGAGFGSLVRTGVNIPRILAGATENMTKGITITDDGAIVFADADNPFSALARSFADLYIENLTEIAGPTLKKGVLAAGVGVGKKFPVLQKFTKVLADKWITNRTGRTISSFLKASATKVGYDGILEEMGEEQLGRMLRSVTGLQSFGEMVPSMEDLLVEAGIFAVPGGVSLASTKIFRKDVPTKPIEKRLGFVGEELETGKPTEAITEGKVGIPTKEEFVNSPEGKEIITGIINSSDVGVVQEVAETRAYENRVAAIKSEKKVINQYLAEHDASKGTVPASEPFLSTRDEEFAKRVDEGKESGRESALFPKELEHAEDAIRIGEKLGYKPDDIAAYLQKNYIEAKPAKPITEPSVKIGKEAESITEKVVKTTIETKTNAIKANVKEASIEPTGTIDAIRRNVSRAEDALGHWGTAGVKVQRDLREISARTAINTGNTTQNIKGILKGLSSAEKIKVAQIADKVIKNQPSRLTERARLLTVELDLMQIEAQDVGLRTEELTGRAFPQIPNKKGKAFLEEAEVKGAKSHQVFAWAQIQVNKYQESKGKKGFKTIDAAIAALQNYRRTKLRGTEGYFEGKRTIELDLDMREWGIGTVLPGIIEGGWEAIEGARQWGITKDGNFKDIRTSIERIRQEVGVDQANLLEDYIKAQYGQSKASVAAKKWNKRARAIQFVGKLALSPLTITRNMLDRYAKGLTHGTIGTNIRATLKFPPFLNRWLKTSQKLQDEMIRQGAVLGHGHLSEGFASGGAISRFIGQPFALSERGNQTYIAIVKKLQLEADIKRLHEMGGEKGTIGKMYNRMLTVVGQSQQQIRSRLLTNLTNEQLADALSQKEISDDVMSEVLHRTVTDSAFPLTLASKRMWWGNRPFVQTAVQFKVWSADQMRFIYKDVIKYTLATGDPSRLARFIIGTWLAGELYNIARDFLLGKDESLVSTLKDPNGRNFTEISKSVGNALIDGGIVGMLADLTYGITDWAFGPTVGSIRSALEGVIETSIDPAKAPSGFKKFILDDIPAAKQAQGILDRIDRTFFDDDNLTEHYAKWRKRSFDFRKKKGELTEAERLVSGVFLGRSRRLPGPRTLSLEMIARQILVGDPEDAADYIVAIFKDTKPEKLKNLRASFMQSAKNNSPLGNMRQEDIPKFMNQFSKEGQAEIVSIQLQWNKNYNKAYELAAEQLKEDKFFEKLKEELVE